MISSMEPVLPLYLQSTFGLDVSKIGLVYIAAVVPSFVCTFYIPPKPTTHSSRLCTHAASPLSGWYADRGGTIVSTAICLVCALPFWVLVFIHVDLAYFLVMYALLSKCFPRCDRSLHCGDDSYSNLRPVCYRDNLTSHGRVRGSDAQPRWRRM